MNRFIVLATVIAVAYGEAPISGGYSGGGGSVSAGTRFATGGGSSGSGLNEYVDQALLNRVAAVLQSNGDGTASQQDNEGSRYVDSSILTRVASSLGDSGSSRSGSSSGGYGAPAPSGGSASLGQPEPAQRIAEWDLSETRQSTGGSSSGGYSGPVPQPGGGYPAPAPQQPSGGYGAPSRSVGGGSRGSSSGGAISLGQPESAQRVAEFEVQDGQQGGTGSRGTSGGY